MKEKYLEYLYDKVINEESNDGDTGEQKAEEFKKAFDFQYSKDNKDILRYLRNKTHDEIVELRDKDPQISAFLEGRIYLYEVIASKRTFYFIHDSKIYCGKFIDIPNGENDMYEIVFSETKKLKTQDIKDTEKLNLSVSNIRVLSKIYLIIVTCPYFKKENNTVFYFSTIENSNFKTTFKDKDETESMVEITINYCEKEVKNEIKNIVELVHESDIEKAFSVLKENIKGIIKNAYIKNKIYENFMNSVESSIGVKLNKYTFNYRKKDKIRVCVAFSKNKTVNEIQKTIESASHKFKN